MKLGDLYVENFMSVESASTNLTDKGLVLIQGTNDDDDSFESNGSGKSTMFSEAVTWCITGKTIRDMKPDKVINRTAKKNCMVKTSILDDNGDVYQVERYRKHAQHGNHVLVFRNGVNITAKSDTDTNKLIEDLIGMDYLTFTNSIMFGQGISKMFASTTDAEQKKILEQMLQIDVFRKCQEKAKEKAESKRDKVSELSISLNEALSLKTKSENNISELQDAEIQLSANVKYKVRELNSLLGSCIEDLESCEVDRTNLVVDKGALKMHEERLLKSLEKYKDGEAEESRLKISIGSSQRAISNAEKSIRDLTKRLDDIVSGADIPKTCVACGQSIPAEDTSHVQNHLKDSIKSVRGDLQEEQDLEEHLRDKLAAASKRLEGKADLEASIREIQDGIRDINKDMKYSDSRKLSLEESIDYAKRQIVEQEQRLNTTYAPLINKEIEAVKELDKAIKKYTIEVNKAKDELSKYEFWVNAYGNQGIKSVLLDSVTPFLNQRCSYYTSKLTGSSIDVTFNTQTTLKNGEKRDKFSVDIDNTNGDEGYDGNSGGEKRRVDIAINMTLQDLVLSRTRKKLDFIVYDECFDGLDSIGCENVIHLLHERVKSCGTVYVITHSDNLKQLFSKSVRVRKSDGKTIVEDEVI